MRKRFRFMFQFITMMLLVSACSLVATGKPERLNDQFVLVQGGSVMNTLSNYYGSNITLADFYIGKY